MLVNGHLHSQRVKGAVCNLSCQAELAALQRFSKNLLMYCRHSKQMLYVVIYQDCGKLSWRPPVCQAELAATVTSV